LLNGLVLQQLRMIPICHTLFSKARSHPDLSKVSNYSLWGYGQGRYARYTTSSTIRTVLGLQVCLYETWISSNLLSNHTISSHSISNRHWGHVSTRPFKVLILNQSGETGRGGTGHITLPFISDISWHRNFEYIVRSSCPLCTSPMRPGDDGHDI
jgi:hypothetical protein